MDFATLKRPVVLLNETVEDLAVAPELPKHLAELSMVKRTFVLSPNRYSWSLTTVLQRHKCANIHVLNGPDQKTLACGTFSNAWWSNVFGVCSIPDRIVFGDESVFRSVKFDKFKSRPGVAPPDLHEVADRLWTWSEYADVFRPVGSGYGKVAMLGHDSQLYAGAQFLHASWRLHGLNMSVDWANRDAKEPYVDNFEPSHQHKLKSRFWSRPDLGYPAFGRGASETSGS